MQRYLEPGVDLALTLGLIFLLRPLEELLNQPDISNLWISIPAVLALPLGFWLLRHVESGVPSRAEKTEPARKNNSCLMLIYVYLLLQMCLGLVLVSSGMYDSSKSQDRVYSSLTEQTRSSDWSGILQESLKEDLEIFKLVVIGVGLNVILFGGAWLLYRCIHLQPKRSYAVDSKVGLVLRTVGLLALGCAFLVLVSFSSITIFEDYNFLSNHDFTTPAVFDMIFLLTMLPVWLLLALVFHLFYLPVYSIVRAYNPSWLRSATYVLNLVVAAFMVMW